jgi:DHA2 family multidrug resistance protein-like MFS transporter
MSPHNRWLILAIVSSALFLIVVDMTVLYTALPRLTHDLGASASEKLWIVNAYALVVAGLLPGLGTLGDRLGHKRPFIAGLAVFGLASLIAAYAPNPSILIAGRVLLAVGAALMMPATLSIIRLTFTDERERALAIGIWAAIASGGAAIGPVLGGFLLEYFWWGSVFLINVPIVAVALLLGMVVLPDSKGNKDHPWDPLGSVQIMVGLVGLAYAIKEMSKREPSAQAGLIAAVIGAVALVVFVRRQRRSAHPMIDFGLFRNAAFSSGVAAALVTSGALVGVELVLTQRLQLVAGYSPLEAGIFILPIPLAAFVAGPLTGMMLPRLGPEMVLRTGLITAAAGLGAFLAVHEAGALGQIVSLVVLGLGVGATMTAASSAIMSNAPPQHAGMAASIEEVSFELGGAIGIAVLGSVMSAVYTAFVVLPEGAGISAIARDSLDEALILAEKLSPDVAESLVALARTAFEKAFVAVVVLATGLLVTTGAGIWWFTRGKSRQPVQSYRGH